MSQTTVEFIHPGDVRRIMDGMPQRERDILIDARFRDDAGMFQMLAFITPAAFEDRGEDFWHTEYARMVEAEAFRTPKPVSGETTEP